jgi:hypothetical protein
MSFKFFKSQFNPTGLTGKVGGSIVETELSGYLGELFAHQYAYPIESTGAVVQYRKVFVKNEYSMTSTDTRIWLDAQHTSGQIYLALQTGSLGTGSVQRPPSDLYGWVAPNSYSGGLNIGTLHPTESTGIWLRQTLTSIESSNPYTSLRLYVGGIVE